MKKAMNVFLAVICIAVLLAGCGRDDDKKPQESTGNVTLGDYKSLEVTVGKSAVTEPAIQSYIERMIESYVGEGAAKPSYSELTDEFVATKMADTECKTVEELKKKVSDYLNGLNEYYAENNTRSAIVEKLAEICTVKKMPDDLLKKRADIKEKLFKANCQKQYGMEFSEYLISCQMTEESFREQTVKNAKEELESVLILKAIAEKEKIVAGDGETKKFAEEMTENYGYENTEKLYSDYGEDYIKDECLCDKVLKMLIGCTKVNFVSPSELS